MQSDIDKQRGIVRALETDSKDPSFIDAQIAQTHEMLSALRETRSRIERDIDAAEQRIKNLNYRKEHAAELLVTERDKLKVMANPLMQQFLRLQAEIEAMGLEAE